MADSKIDDGGPAFSGGLFEPQHGGSNDRDPMNPGMSLRQYYAGQALAGLCANPGGPFQANTGTGWDIVNCDAGHVADWCNELADALIARQKAGA